MSEVLKSSQGSLFIQLTPGKAPEYFGCVDLDDIAEPAGDQSLILCRDANGDFKTVGSTAGAPGAVTTSMTAVTFPESDIFDRIKSCLITLYAMTRSCGRAGIFGNYVRGAVVHHARITTRTLSNLVKRVDDTEILRKLDISAWFPVYLIRELTVGRQTVAETRDLNDIVFCNAEQCGGDCGVVKAAGTDGYAVSDGNAGTPYLNGDVWLTADGGGAWANATGAAISPFSEIDDILSAVCFGIGRNQTRLLVAKKSTATVAKVSYSDDAGATWNEVTVGAVNPEGAAGQGALFALDWEHIWFATDKGNIYFSDDGGATWDLQASVTPSGGNDLNAVKFSDTDNGWAVGDSDTLIHTTDGGTTWTAVTPPTTSDDVTALHAWSRDRLIIGSDAGELWESWDEGDTWEQKSYTGKVATDTVKDLDFINDLVGFMLVDTVAPVGSVHRSIDGGHNWEKLTTPTNAGLNALAVIDENQAFAVGNAQAGTAVILKVSG